MPQTKLLHFHKRTDGKWGFTYLCLCAWHATPKNSPTQLLQRLGEDSSEFLENLDYFIDKRFRAWKIHNIVPTGSRHALYDTVNVVVVKEEEGLSSQASRESQEENDKMRDDSPI